MIVREWESFRVSFLKRDYFRKSLLRSECCGLAKKVWVDVGANDPVGPRRVSCEPAIQYSRPTPNLQDDLARPEVYLIDYAPYDA
jgi:hypothetical protein